MKKRYIIYFTVLIVVLFNHKTILGQKVIDRPVSFFKMTDDIRVKYYSDGEKSGIWWTCYSAQDNNSTYLTSAGMDENKQLNFLDKFYITEINNNYAHIYKDMDFNAITWDLSNDAKDYGWIKLKYLLLTPYCLVTPKSQIAKKCMVLNTYNSLKRKDLQSSESDFVNFYLDPELKTKTGRRSQIFQIFYVYKIKTKKGKKYSVLIGTSQSIGEPENEDDVKNTIKGWVSYDRIVEWNHRIAVEPNYEYEAAEERKNNNIKTSIFESLEKSKDFQQGKIVNPNFVVWNKDTYEERKIGSWIRFPLINMDNDIYRLGVMGNLDNSLGDLLLTREEDADMRAKTANTSLKYRKINVVFVVDGTSSMGRYFQSSIVPAIKETITKLVNNQTFNDFHFGALVYRDADEGERLTEQIQLTTNSTNLINKLKNIEAVDYSDNSTAEALYKGLYGGLRSILNSNDETNLIILIGDAGNREDKRTHVSTDQLTDWMYKRNASIVCFQVHNGSKPEYDDFKKQTMSLINIVAQKHMDDQKGTQEKLGKIHKLQYSDNGNNSYIWDGAKYFECIYASKGETKSTVFLKDAIVRAITKENDRINKVITMRNLVFEEGVSFDNATKVVNMESTSSLYNQTDGLGAGFIKLMKDAGLNDEQISKAVQDKVQIYSEGISPLSNANLTHPLYKRVLLYSAEEFNRMSVILNDLVGAREIVERREKLYSTWIDILKRYLGNIDISELEEMSISEIQSMVFGLPGVEGIIKDISLNQIKDEDKISDDEINKYLSSIRQKISKINSIVNQVNYPYVFYTNNKKYYWIDEGFIP